MRRMYERSTKARLSFSGGPHAPVNMANSMENVGSWTVSGSRGDGSTENFKDLRKRGVRNIAQYSAANVPFPAFFLSDILFFHTIRHVYWSKLSPHDCETRL